MARHIFDRSRPGTATRLRRYLMLERMDSPHPVTRGLRGRNAAESGAGRRLREFMRIARGRPV